MITALKIARAMGFLAVRALATLYIGWWIYVLPAIYPRLAGMPQFVLVMIVLLVSMVSCAITVSRLPAKRSA